MSAARAKSGKPASPQTASAWGDPGYEQGVVELLSLLACGEFMAFERLVTEAQLAPRLAQRVRVSQLAVGELAHYNLLRARIAELGYDPEECMEPFVGPLARYHASTAPSDWLEGLVKAYVGDSIALDFYREIAANLDPDTRELILEVCGELGQTEVVLEEVRAAINADPRVAGRLALWGRRLMGEALSQSQAVAAEHDGLMTLVFGAASGITDGAGLMDRLVGAHVARMKALGLSA